MLLEKFKFDSFVKDLLHQIFYKSVEESLINTAH